MKDRLTPDAAKETKQLLTGYTQKVRCHLAVRDFEAASDTAVAAINLYRWEDERLRRDFDLPKKMQGAAPVVELLQSVSEAVGGLRRCNECLRRGSEGGEEAWTLANDAELLLERRAWAATTPLQAELFAARCEAALLRPEAGAHVAADAQAESLAVAEVDAERALALDVGCARAQRCLREVRRSRSGS